MYLSFIGRLDEALTEIKRAQELDPLSLNTNFDVGLVYYYARRYDEAIAQCRRVLEMDQGFLAARGVITWSYLLQGAGEAAIAEYTRQPLVDPQVLGYVYGAAGHTKLAQRELERLTVLAQQRSADPFNVAMAYMTLGHKDEALDWLDNTYKNLDTRPELIDLKVDPRLDQIRSEPRFAQLLRDIGL